MLTCAGLFDIFGKYFQLCWERPGLSAGLAKITGKNKPTVTTTFRLVLGGQGQTTCLRIVGENRTLALRTPTEQGQAVFGSRTMLDYFI